jgi:hypothetical protein
VIRARNAASPSMAGSRNAAVTAANAAAAASQLRRAGVTSAGPNGRRGPGLPLQASTIRPQVTTMGEYAREDIMRNHGVDIGGDEPPRRPKVQCPTCGRMFSKFGVSMHHQDKHGTALLNLPTGKSEVHKEPT